MGGRTLPFWFQHRHAHFYPYLWGCIVLFSPLVWCWVSAKDIHTVQWGFPDKISWCHSTWSVPLDLKYYLWIRIFPFSYLPFMCWPPWIFDEVYANYKSVAIQVIFLGEIIHNNLPICHIFPSIFRYIFVGQKKMFLCLTSCHQLLDPARPSHWRKIWSKLVCVLFFKWSVFTP